MSSANMETGAKMISSYSLKRIYAPFDLRTIRAFLRLFETNFGALSNKEIVVSVSFKV